MLETIREYALDQLAASGEETDARRAHAAYFLRFAEEAGAGLRGPQQQQWRDALEADLDNLRAALAWTLASRPIRQDADTGLLLVGALWYFWFQRGLTGEARRWLSRALDAAPSRGRARAQALLGAGTLAWRQGDCATARDYLDESVGSVARGRRSRRSGRGPARPGTRPLRPARLRRRAGPVRGEPRRRSGERTTPLGGLPLLGDLGLVAYHEGDYGSAERILRESLALYREHGLKDRVAGALNAPGRPGPAGRRQRAGRPPATRRAWPCGGNCAARRASPRRCTSSARSAGPTRTTSWPGRASSKAWRCSRNSATSRESGSAWPAWPRPRPRRAGRARRPAVRRERRPAANPSVFPLAPADQADAQPATWTPYADGSGRANGTSAWAAGSALSTERGHRSWPWRLRTTTAAACHRGGTRPESTTVRTGCRGANARSAG